MGTHTSIYIVFTNADTLTKLFKKKMSHAAVALVTVAAVLDGDTWRGLAETNSPEGGR